MKILRTAVAGTLESSDVLITVRNNPEGALTLEIESVVMKQFGTQIRRVVEETLAELGVSAGIIEIEDRGALDCMIRARLQTAISRAGGNDVEPWRSDR